jgi:3-deoxy-D-manno-octulosonic-acid transferase
LAASHRNHGLQASTHPGEEELVLQAHQQLLQTHDKLAALVSTLDIRTASQN